MAELHQQLRETTDQHHAVESAVAKKTARLEVLRQMFATPDGRLTLGNILEVETQYGPAVEAALNHNLRAILADDLTTARGLLAGNLKNPSVATPELLRATGATPASEVPAEGLAWAVNVVRVRDARFEPLLRALLKDVIVVGDLDAALALRQSQPQLSVATLRGEFLNEHGVLSAVSTSHIGEISALAEEVSQLQTQMAGLAENKAGLEGLRDELEVLVRRLRDELHANDVTLASREGEISALDTERRDFESKVHTVIFELQGIEQQDTEEKQRRTDLQAALAQSQAREGQLREQMAGWQQTINELTGQREQLISQLTELRVAAGGIQHNRTAIQAQREPIAGRIRDLGERIQICTNRSSKLAACNTSGVKLPAASSSQKSNCAPCGCRRRKRKTKNPVSMWRWRRSGWKSRI